MVALRSLISLLLLILANDASADCMRLVRNIPGAVPGTDGPGGIFGPLGGTLSLDCIQYEGIKKQAAGTAAIVRDEQGKVYLVHVREYLGENGGRIEEIKPNRITISQVVTGPDGNLVEINRYLFNKGAKTKGRGKNKGAR